jgi:hypothetical protein
MLRRKPQRTAVVSQQGFVMLVFLDTEFTDLVNQPRLLSVALVTDLEGGKDFYAEVTDLDRIQATNWFGLSTVLPQFGHIPGAACSYAELGARLGTYLGDLVENLPENGVLEIAYGYHLDWELVELAIRDAGAPLWELTRRGIQPVNVYELTGYGVGKLAAEHYQKTQAHAPFSRHHALCDARALRLAYEASTRSPVHSELTIAPHGGRIERHAAA